MAAVERLVDSGRLFFMVTGRFLSDLQNVFPYWRICSRIVAENGAILFDPATGQKQRLADRPPDSFIKTLRRKGVVELGTGEVLISSNRSYDKQVVAAIAESGLPLEVTSNYESLMILPAGIDKASGLQRALADLQISTEDVVGIGDAENDHAFLDICGCSVAVANALPELKKKADVITQGERGAGVAEIIDQIIRNDLADVCQVRA